MLAFDALCRFLPGTFPLGMYFLLVAVVLSGRVKQVTALPWHIALQGSFYDPVYETIVCYVPFPC